MSNLFLQKIIILLLFMAMASIGVSQERVDIFEQKWTEAQTHLDNGQMERLIVTIKELENSSTQKNTTRLGKIAFLNAEYWHAKEKWSKAVTFLKTATKHLQKDTAELFYLAESYLLLGSCYHDLEALDKSLASYQQSLKLKQKIYNQPHIKISNLYFNIGFLFQAKEQFIKADEAFENGLAILKELYPEENAQFADFYEELGYNAYTKNNFEPAISFLQNALQLKKRELGDNHEDLVFTYNYLGGAHFQNELFGEAINYFLKALQIVEKQQKRDVLYEGLLHCKIGKSYAKLKKYDKAFVYLDKAIAIDKNNSFLLSSAHLIRGIEASSKKNTTAANIHFDIAIEALKKKNNDFLVPAYRAFADHHLSTNNPEKALSTINKAIVFSEKHSPEKLIALFDLYLTKGKCFRQLKNSSQALVSYSKAFNVNGRTYDKTVLTIKQLKNLVSLNLEHMELYQTQPSKEIADLLKIDSLISSTIALIDYINKNYQERITKENFIEEHHNIFSIAIKTKLELYSLTKDKKHLASAFKVSEKSKNLILLETIKNVNAFELAGVPKNLVEQEQKLRNKITYLENQRYQENQENQENEIDRDLIRSLNGKIFDLKEERQKLLEKIKKTYPAYYELKFEPSFTSIKEIQQKILLPNQTILEYFVDESTIYAFLIKKDDFQVFALPTQEDLVLKINQFRESIFSYRPPSINGKEETTALINHSNRLGFELYQALIQPIQDHLTQRIILITDGALSYLPFDALLTSPTNKDENFTDVTYLLEQYQISYAHSVNWLSELYGKLAPEFNQNFVGFAPVFKENNNTNDISDFRIGLGPLGYNQEEVHNIKKNIGGTVITDINATRKAFLEYLQKGQVLHLATHGKSNDLQGDYSYLAFSEPQDTSDNQFLYVKDLFNLKIPADLVVLSACETGLGEIKKGEGIVGIGKGFSYAGVKSMVTTLWRVSDNSTANFMPVFYENLKAGLPKDEALWSAKKEFIKNNRSNGHPFFWAGYVAYGNMNPIEFQHTHWPISYLITIIVLIGIIGSLFLRRFLVS